jgi:hypothetical protein
MYHKQVGNASILALELEGDRVVSTRYLPPPKLNIPSPSGGG